MTSDNENELYKIEKRIRKDLKTCLENENDSIRKIIDRHYKYPSYLITGLTGIIIAIGFFTALNLKSEREQIRQELREFKQQIDITGSELRSNIENTRKELISDIEARFNASQILPEIALYSDIDTKLSGQTIIAQYKTLEKEKEPFTYRIRFLLTLCANESETSTP
jgi:hypothetical protein